MTPSPRRQTTPVPPTPRVLRRASSIPAGRFKAICLAVMDTVQRSGEPITVTKRGTPVVRIVPAQSAEAGPLFGRLRGNMRINGDITQPLDVEWNALADD